MNTFHSLQALRRANPRSRPEFAQSVEAAANTVPALIAADARTTSSLLPTRTRRRLVRVSLASASVAAAAAAAAFVTVGSLGNGPGVDTASAAVEKAATLTAASAERSGTAVVRITHEGQLWAGSTVRWNGQDLDVARDYPLESGRSGSEMIVVDGILYGPGPDTPSGWLKLGSPANIDPDSGTTPAEYLAAVREDIGGTTLRRMTAGMKGLARSEQVGGSTVYRGTVAAGLIARETGFKEGQAIRVLPFGYVAHDAAANPAAPLDVALTVGADGVVRQITVTWGAWNYTVAYSALGATPAPRAPAGAVDLLAQRGLR